MTRRIVEHEGRIYTFSPDNGIPLSERLWALVGARTVDELTGQPPESRVTLGFDQPGIVAKATNDGIVVLVGKPRHFLPTLARQDYSLHFTLRAEGYITHQVTATVPTDQRTIAAPAPVLNDNAITLDDTARLSEGEILLIGPAGPHLDIVKIRFLGPAANQVTFEPPLSHLYVVGDPVVPVVAVDFAPFSLGDLMLHREPVFIRGRTVQATGITNTALPGAMVRITGIWRTLPPADLDPPAEPPNIVSLQPPLYSARAATTGRIRRREMSPVMGEDKHLLEAVRPGSNRLRLSDRVNLSPTDIIVIDVASPDVTEYLTVDTVSGSSTADQPAAITLTYPSAHPHRRDAVVRKVTPQVPGPDNPFDQDAIIGDTCVLLTSMNDLGVATVVEISGGGDPAEYHRLRRFSVISDGDGYYRLPLLSRVAQLQIEATHGGQTVMRTISPNYTHGENRVDFVF